MSDSNDRSKQLEDARTLARITTAWREAEEALAGMEAQLKEAKSQTEYWLGQYSRQARQISDLEARIKELESPLAELARGLADNTNTKDIT